MTKARDLAELQEILPGRNILINGNFDVWQRGASFVIGSTYHADRWGAGHYQNGLATRQDSTIAGSTFNLRMAGDNSNASRISVGQPIESPMAKSLRSKTVTLSFWIRFSGTSRASNDPFYAQVGDTNGTTDDVFNTTNYLATANSTITIAADALPTTWTKYSVTHTVSADANNMAVRFQFTQLATDAFWYEIAQVQLEEGEAATEFEREGYGTVLSKCQRYYSKSENKLTKRVNNVEDGDIGELMVYFPTKMRVTPAISTAITSVSRFPSNAPGVYDECASHFRAELVESSPGGDGYFQFNWTADAEL